MSERIKKQHDLVTYRELVAYSKGEPVDRNNPRSQRARRHRVLRGVSYTLAAASSAPSPATSAPCSSSGSERERFSQATDMFADGLYMTKLVMDKKRFSLCFYENI